MNFAQKAEAFLKDVETDIVDSEHAIVAWFKRLIHHQKAGDTIVPPPQSGTGDGSNQIGTGTAATPIITPAAPPADTAGAAADGSGAAVPALDALGFYVAPGSDGTPIADYVFMTGDQSHQPGVNPQQLLSFEKNDVQNLQDATSVSNDTHRFDPAWFTQGIDVTQPKTESGNYVQLPKAIVCRNAHRDLVPFTLSDFPAAIEYWQQSGVWPKIEHQTAPTATAP